MSLLDEAIKGKSPHRTGGGSLTCCYQEILATDPLFHKELVDATISAVPVAWIVATVREKGFKISESSMHRHRKGQCSLCGDLHESA